jgi:hypothetical protein
MHKCEHIIVCVCAKKKNDFEVGLNKTLTKFYAFQGDILVDNFARLRGPTKIVMKRNGP